MQQISPPKKQKNTFDVIPRYAIWRHEYNIKNQILYWKITCIYFAGKCYCYFFMCDISIIISNTIFSRMLYLAFVKAIYARPATFRFVSQDCFGEVRGVPTSHWWSWVHPGRGLIAISHKREIKLLMYQEKSWHLDHFTCSSCFRPLAGKDYTLEVSSASQSSWSWS